MSKNLKHNTQEMLKWLDLYWKGCYEGPGLLKKECPICQESDEVYHVYHAKEARDVCWGKYKEYRKKVES